MRVPKRGWVIGKQIDTSLWPVKYCTTPVAFIYGTHSLFISVFSLLG